MRDAVSKFMPRVNEGFCSQTQPETKRVEVPPQLPTDSCQKPQINEGVSQSVESQRRSSPSSPLGLRLGAHKKCDP